MSGGMDRDPDDYKPEPLTPGQRLEKLKVEIGSAVHDIAEREKRIEEDVQWVKRAKAYLRELRQESVDILAQLNAEFGKPKQKRKPKEGGEKKPKKVKEVKES